MKTKSIILALCMLPLVTYAQMDFSQQAKEKIAALDMMVGIWEGTGYMYTPAGKESTQVKESIQYKVDDTVLFIEGKGTKTAEDGSTVVIHNALGIVSYNSLTKAYQMNSFISKGMSTQAQLEIKDENNIVWWFKAGPSTIRYSLTFKDNTWNEIGERSMDGENWQPFFEMELKKVG